MDEFRCQQSAEFTHVVNNANDLAVVTVSRSLGSTTARALMRMCNAVLNGDVLDAQRELDHMERVGITDPVTDGH